MTTTTQPLAIWEASSPWWPELHGRGAAEWARSHIDDPADIYRIEFRASGDKPSATIYRWARNDDGHRYLDPETQRPAEAEPVTMELDSLPPDRLLRLWHQLA